MAESQPAHFDSLRQQMIEQIRLYAGLVRDETGTASLDEQVLGVMREVPRHEFVPANLQAMAYLDSPLPIGFGKTISQPFIVALMTDLLDLGPSDHVLEVGTGLGYQAAILAQLADTVYTVEIIEELARQAEETLAALGYQNIRLGVGDGSGGWPEHAPYDKILVAAAPELIPPSLLNQLKAGGKMVIPAGIEDAQQLILVEKDDDGRLTTQEVLRVRFSPLVVPH